MTTDWVPVIVAGVSAAGALGAAVVAGVAASRTKAAELGATKAVELEKRLSSSRTEVFEPLVEAVGRLWDHIATGKPMDPPTFEQIAGAPIRRFTHWVQIYGSDDAVRASLRFMQGTYGGAPPLVLVRLLGDLIVAARRELGYADTEIRAVEVLAMRITDAYTSPEYYADLTDPLETVCARHGWRPPWSQPVDAAERRAGNTSR
jgi:hypothetical protein